MNPADRSLHTHGDAPAQTELQRTVALLLATQQDLIHSRHQRDRELRVLDGIVRFAERAATIDDLDAFWDSVADACASAFECESAIVLDHSLHGAHAVSFRGPAPADTTETAAICAAAEAAIGAGLMSPKPEQIASLRVHGKVLAQLLVAPIGNSAQGQRRFLAAALTQEKRAFFPPLDHRTEPALKLFASIVHAMFEMLRARKQTSQQLAALDRSHGALLESEAKYRCLFEGGADALALCSPDSGKVLDCNAALCELVKLPRERIVGHLAAWPMQMGVDAGVFECEITNASGMAVPVEVRASEVGLDGSMHRLYVLRDITRRKRAESEQRKLQDQLLQARKMESIGRLAGGIAHDFNNLLTVICGCGELLQGSALDDPQQQMLAEMMSASRRAQSLTQQLLTFSRKQLIRPVPGELNEHAQSSIRMYRRLIGEDIALEFAPCSDKTPILADPQQIDQVIGNLLINARDAIHALDDNGQRWIRVTTSIELDPAGAKAKGSYVRLAVQDSGVGIAEAARENLFEPFFTTKEAGKGTGLGLATVFGIVQQNHGAIFATSEPGRGAKFEVLWPMRSEPHAKAAGEQQAAPQHGRELVLLVEDDRGVREFAAQALRTYGYDVRTAACADDALQILDAGAKPRILVTDVVMPKTNGRVLAEEVRRRMPEIPVLFISGYTDDIIAQHGVLRDGVELLEKPFGIAELSQRIRRMLDA
jgi:signal transduction histidine kinase